MAGVDGVGLAHLQDADGNFIVDPRQDRTEPVVLRPISEVIIVPTLENTVPQDYEIRYPRTPEHVSYLLPIVMRKVDFRIKFSELHARNLCESICAQKLVTALSNTPIEDFVDDVIDNTKKLLTAKAEGELRVQRDLQRRAEEAERLRASIDPKFQITTDVPSLLQKSQPTRNRSPDRSPNVMTIEDYTSSAGGSRRSSDASQLDCHRAISTVTERIQAERAVRRRAYSQVYKDKLEKIQDSNLCRVPRCRDVDGQPFADRYLTEPRVFDEVNRITDKLKPVNLANFIVDMVVAVSPAEYIVAIGRILETYGVLWYGTNIMSQKVADVFGKGIKECMMNYTELSTFAQNMTGTTVPQQLVHHADGDYETLFNLLESKDPAVNAALMKLGPVVKVLAPVALVGLSALGCYKPASLVTNALHNMSTVLKDSKTILTSFDGVKKAVDFGFKAAFDNDSLHVYDQIANELVALIKLLQEYKTTLTEDQGAVLADPVKQREIRDTCDKALELARAVTALRDEKTAGMTPLVVSALRLESEVRTQVAFIERTVSWKQEPVCIWLYGEPGVGKSTLTHYLIRLLSKHEGRRLSTYTRNGSDQYQSTYVGQDVMIYDDFGSDVEAKDITEFIPIKTATAYQMVMAAVEDKGKRFTSRYIIVNSNLAGINASDKCSNPHAVDRRRDWLIQVHDKKAVDAINDAQQPDHYLPDFSHLTLSRLNPVRSAAGAYERLVPNLTTPQVLAAEMFTKQQYYKELYEARLASREFDDDLDLDGPVIPDPNPDETVRAIKALLPDPRPADISRKRMYHPEYRPGRRDDMERQPRGDDRQHHPRGRGRGRGRRDEPMMPGDVAARLQEEQYDEPNPNIVYIGRPRDEMVWHGKDDGPVTGGNRLGILIVGEAGIGKTTLAKLIQETAKQEKINTVIHDDYQRNRRTEERAYLDLWNYHDGHTDVLPILTCNELKRTPVNNTPKDAILRRCRLYECSLSVVASMQRKLGRQLHFPGCVVVREKTCIADRAATNKVIQYVDVPAAALNPERSEAIQLRVTLDDFGALLPSDELVIDLSENELAGKNLGSFITGGVGVTSRGSKLTLIQRATLISLVSGFVDRIGMDPRRALLTANMKRVKAPKWFTGLTFYLKDVTYVLSPVDGILTFFLAGDATDAKENYENIKAIIEHERTQKRDSFAIFMEVVEGFFFTIKLSGLLAATVFAGMSRMKQAKRAIMTHESRDGPIENWADHMEAFERGEVEDALTTRDDDPEYIPKNMRQRTGLEDSDPQLKIKRPDTTYQYESIERRRPPPPRQPVKNAASELTQEAVNVLKRAVPQRRAAPMVESAAYKLSPVAQVDLKNLPILAKMPTHIADDQLEELVGEALPALEAQAVRDPQAMALVPLIQQNTVFVGTEDRIVQRALMIQGSVGIVNAHALSMYQPGDIFKVFECSVGGNMSHIAEVVTIDKKRDHLIFKIKSGRQFKSILKHLPNDQDTYDYDGKFAWLVYCYPDMTKTLTSIVCETAAWRTVSGEQKFGLQYRGHAQHVVYGPINSVKGLCGSVVLITCPHQERKIVALHAAATEREGLGVILSQRLFHELTAHAVGPEESISVLKHQCVLPIKPLRIGEHLIVVGVPHDGQKVLHQHKITMTQLYRSPLALTDASPFEPCVLSPLDNRPHREVDVFTEGVHRYDRAQGQMNLDDLDRVVEEIGDYYAHVIHASGIRLKKLTKTEALNGLSYISQSNPLARDSSPGFPWKHFVRTPKKSEFLHFNAEERHWEIAHNEAGQALHHGIDSLINAAKKGQRTAVVNIALLKDEPRKLKRIYDDPETRIFWSAPIDKVFADRIYFHAAAAAIAATHEKHPIKIGINPQSIGFHQLYSWLAKVSQQGFDLDTKNWDGSVPVCMIMRLYRIWNRIYEVNDPNCTEEDQRVRQTLHRHLVRPLILYNECVVQLPGGNISGQSLTAVDNSIINDCYHYYVWLQLMRKAGRKRDMTLASFREHVGCAFYGDDVLDTVHPQFTGLFTPAAYVAECAKFGVICTPADKKGTPCFKHLSECEFLKRNFVRATLPDGSGGPYFCGALQIDSFHKMLDYTQCSKSHHFWKESDLVKFDPESIGQVVACALIESVAYGRGFFEKMSRHLREKCTQHRIRVVNWPSYIACYNLLWDLDLPGGSQDGETIEHHAAMSSGQPLSTGSDGQSVSDQPQGVPGTPVDPSEVGAIKTSSLITATGDYGSLPQEWYEKPILIATVPWSSATPAGTVLWHVELKPGAINQYVGYFAALYNAWVGGAKFLFEVIGTGFHGGKLAVVRIPPNRDISVIKTPTDCTVFHFQLMDAKEMACVGKELVDQRNTLFHWRDDVDTQGRGGTLAVVVFAPLINASTTLTTINVLIFGQPAPDFRLSQPLPLSTLEEAPNFLPRLSNLFSFSGIGAAGVLTGGKLVSAIVKNSTFQLVTSRYQYGMVNGDGVSRYRKLTPAPKTLCGSCVDDGANVNRQADNWIDVGASWYGDLTGYSALDLLTLPQFSVGRPLTVNVFSLVFGINHIIPRKLTGDPGFFWTTGSSPTVIATLDLSQKPAVTSPVPTNISAYEGILYKMPAVQVDEQIATDLTLRWSPPLAESIVLFQEQQHVQVSATAGPGATTIALYQSAQYVNMVNEFNFGSAKGILTPGQAVLFTVTDVPSGLPVDQWKLYYEGFVTSATSPVDVVFGVDKLSVEATAIVPANTPIPPRADIVSNRLFVSARDRPPPDVRRLARQVAAQLQADFPDGVVLDREVLPPISADARQLRPFTGSRPSSAARGDPPDPRTPRAD